MNTEGEWPEPGLAAGGVATDGAADRAPAGPNAVLERIADGVYACDRAWRYTYLNAAAERQVGRSRADLVGRVLWEAFPEAIGSPFQAAAQQAEATGEPAHAETWFAPLATWFDASVFPAADGFTIVSRDVTARKRAETRLGIIQDVTAKLMAAATAEAVAGVVLRDGMRAAGASASALYLRRDDHLELVGAEGHDAEVVRRYRRLPLDAAAPVAEAARLGEAAWFTDLGARCARYPHLAEVFASQPHEGTAYVPFRRNDAVLGALNLSFPDPRAFDPDDRAFIQALADLAAQALERADLYDRLDHANARFARAEAAAGAFSYEWNVVTGLVERSANVAGVLGYAGNEIGDAWEDWAALIHPDDLGVSRDEAIDRLARSAEPVLGAEYRARHKDGSWRWLRERIAPLRDEAGRLRCIVGQTVDVTERRAMEAALGEREQQLRLIADALPVLIAYVDRDRCYRFNNRAYEAWFGHDPATFLGQRIEDGLGAAAYAAIAPHVAAALAGERTTFGLEVPYRAGGARHVEATYVPDVAPDGTVRGFVSLVADVTQRATAARREREQSDRMRTLADVSRELAAARLDLPATLEVVAREAAAVLGGGSMVRLRSADGSALEPMATHHPNPAAAAELRRLAAAAPIGIDEGWSGQVARTREPLLIPVVDGAALSVAKPEYRPYAERFGMGSAAIVPLAVGERVLGTVMVWRDDAAIPYGPDDLSFLLALADRAALAIDNARLLRESREAESRVRRLFDAGVVGLMVADPERILEANDRFLAMVGLSRDDLAAGRLRWREMTPAEYRPLDERALAELAAIGTCTPYEKEYARPDGSRVPILIGGAMLDAAPPRSVSFVLDLSNQKALERLQQDFLATVSHDLKGPLTAILGQAQLLRRRADRGATSAAQMADGLDRIVAAADRMAGMVDELVDVAQLRAGQALSLVRGPVDLAELAEACAAEHRAAAPRHRIAVALEAGEGAESEGASEGEAPVTVWGDARRLRRVFDNLLGNAVKYSPGGGEVAIGLRRETDAAGEWAVVAVRDEGVGIPAADLPHVFERFRRGHNAAAVARGSGIGLAGARQIVEQHGGAIAVASEVGRGSTVTVRLPLIAGRIDD